MTMVEKSVEKIVDQFQNDVVPNVTPSCRVFNGVNNLRKMTGGVLKASFVEPQLTLTDFDLILWIGRFRTIDDLAKDFGYAKSCVTKSVRDYLNSQQKRAENLKVLFGVRVEVKNEVEVEEKINPVVPEIEEDEKSKNVRERKRLEYLRYLENREKLRLVKLLDNYATGEVERRGPVTSEKLVDAVRWYLRVIGSLNKMANEEEKKEKLVAQQEEEKPPQPPPQAQQKRRRRKGKGDKSSNTQPAQPPSPPPPPVISFQAAAGLFVPIIIFGLVYAWRKGALK